MKKALVSILAIVITAAFMIMAIEYWQGMKMNDVVPCQTHCMKVPNLTIDTVLPQIKILAFVFAAVVLATFYLVVTACLAQNSQAGLPPPNTLSFSLRYRF